VAEAKAAMLLDRRNIVVLIVLVISLSYRATLRNGQYGKVFAKISIRDCHEWQSEVASAPTSFLMDRFAVHSIHIVRVASGSAWDALPIDLARRSAVSTGYRFIAVKYWHCECWFL
jgi:hypothetical protein